MIKNIMLIQKKKRKNNMLGITMQQLSNGIDIFIIGDCYAKIKLLYIKSNGRKFNKLK